MLISMNCMPVAAKISSRGTTAKRPLELPLRAGVAVGDRRRQEFALAIEEPEVDAPGVDADADDVVAKLAMSLSQAVENVRPQVKRSPIEAAVDAHRGMAEPVDFAQLEGLAIQQSGENPTAGGPQIDGEEDFVRHSGK